MSSPAARAEARRKAILSRGSDRLAKLTTSGRGKDAPAYIADDPPLPKLSALDNFVGEETMMPPPPQRNFGTPDPSVWSEQQQQQLMQALMMGRMPQESRDASPSPKAGASATESTLPPMPNFADNPLFAQLMAASGGGDGGAGFGPGMGMNPKMGGPGLNGPQLAVAKPKTTLQKLLPLIHVLSMWALLAYFVFFQEPQLYEAIGGLANENRDRVMVRWSAFAKEVARVQAVVRQSLFRCSWYILIACPAVLLGVHDCGGSIAFYAPVHGSRKLYGSSSFLPY